MHYYTAILNGLGFKDRIKTLGQENSKRYMATFLSTAYKCSFINQQLAGYLIYEVVSDCLIIKTRDGSLIDLRALLDAVKTICCNEFSINGILMRGVIIKVELDKPVANESLVDTILRHQQVYVDAYMLEGSVKTFGIVLSIEMYHDLINTKSVIKKEILVEYTGSVKHYIYRYLSIDYLMESSNLQKFVIDATDSNWLPHYYNTLYFSMKKENSTKVDKLFSNIIALINGANPSEHWKDLDLFIRNAFSTEVELGFQTRFLKYIRSFLP